MTDGRIIQQLEDRIIALEKGQTKTLEILTTISETLKPLSETYKTATTLGKWFMAFLVFLSIIIGIVLGIGKLIK